MIVFFLTSQVVLAQSGQGQEQIDSLVRVLSAPATSASDSATADILIELAYHCADVNPVQGVSFGSKGLDIAKRLGSKPREAMAHYNLGYNFCVMGNFPPALDHWSEAARIFENLKDSSEVANCMMGMGKVHVEMGNCKMAIDCYSKARSIFESLGADDGVAYADGDIGTAYLTRKDYPKALSYYRQALAKHIELDDTAGVAIDIGNVGNALMSLDSFSEAMSLFFDAVDRYKKLGDKNNYMKTTGNIGECYLRIATSSRRIEVSKFIPAGSRANLVQAVHYLRQCLAMATDLGNQKSRQSYSKLLSEAEQLSGHYEEALDHFKLFTAIKDSIFSISKASEIEKLTTRRETQLKEKDLEIQKKQIALAQLKKRNERMYFISGFLLLVGIAIIIFNNYRVKTRNKLLQAYIQGEEEERLRIASELHDDVGATLSSIRLFLTQAELHPDISLISQSKNVLDDSIQKIRDLSHQLQPRTLQYLGLARALESLAELISRSGSLHMEFIQKEEQWPEPEPQTALSAYRIVQELINNIVKHANATWIKLTLETQQGKYCIHIAHDGFGLTEASYAEQLYKKRAIGLKNIENRLKSSRITLAFPDPKNDTYSIALYLPG